METNIDPKTLNKTIARAKKPVPVDQTFSMDAEGDFLICGQIASFVTEADLLLRHGESTLRLVFEIPVDEDSISMSGVFGVSPPLMWPTRDT